MRRIYGLWAVLALVGTLLIAVLLSMGSGGSPGQTISAADANREVTSTLPLLPDDSVSGQKDTPMQTQSSEDCLGVPAYPEIKPGNTEANRTPGEPIPASQYQEWNPGFAKYKALINGQGCLGTTEQILEWAAKKWGFADQPSPFGGPALNMPDIAKAMAVQESDWRQWFKGDYHDGTCDWTGGPDCPYPHDYQSYGLTMVKRTSWPGSYPLSAKSTAFAADYAMAVLRHNYDGASWLASEVKGDFWASVGAWYSGQGGWGDSWYTDDVKRHYDSKPWRDPDF